MRHYMTDPDNEERLLKIPPFVVAVIKAEAYTEAREAVEKLSCGHKSLDVLRSEVLHAIDSLKKSRDD